MQLIYLFARLPQPKNNGVVDIPLEGVENKIGPRTRGSNLAKAPREKCEKKVGVAPFGIFCRGGYEGGRGDGRGDPQQIALYGHKQGQEGR